MIVIEGLGRRYAGSPAWALDGVSLKIEEGEVVGLLGENAAGKTTLLKLAAGLMEPTRGSVTIDGTPALRADGKIAFMTEQGTFFPFMTPVEHADFMEDYYDRFNRDRYFKLLEYFELPGNKKARAFSTGQKAKLEISIGLSKGCRYLLFDEPFLGNDVFTRRDFLRLMGDSLLDGETILLATHLINEIDNFIDRAVILKQGKVVRDCLIDEIRAGGQTLEDVMREASGYDEKRYRHIFGTAEME